MSRSPFLLLVLSILTVSQARAQKACNELSIFAHIVCEEILGSQCASAAQFGCVTTDSNTCALNPILASVNLCPDNRYPITRFILSPNSLVAFRLTVRYDPSRIVLFLIDASSSMREQLPNVVTELSVLAECLISELSATIEISVFAGEESFANRASQIRLQAATNNITAVQDALAILYDLQLFSGPTTLLQALADTIIGCGSNIIIVVGNTPGREPPCRMDDSREFLDRSNALRPDFCFASATTVPTASLVAVSVGQPGLNAAMPVPSHCPISSSSNSSACLDSDECDPPVVGPLEQFRCVSTCEPDPVTPVAQGQLSAVSSIVNGSVVGGLNALAVFNTVQRIIESDAQRLRLPIGKLLRDLDPPLPPGRGDDCGDRVVITSPELPMNIVTLPVNNFSMVVSLSDNACENGPFVCTLIIHLVRTAILRDEQRFIVSGCL